MKAYPHLLFVLVLTHAAMSLLASIGEVLFVGTALYLVVPVVRGGVLLWAAVAAGRGFVAPDEPPRVPVRPLRRWPLVLLIVTAQVGVFGYVLSNLIGVLPWVSDTVNLVGLLTNVALPTAITWLTARMLGTWRRPAQRVPAPPSLLHPVPTLPPNYRPALPPTLVDPLAGPALTPVTKLLPLERAR